MASKGDARLGFIVQVYIIQVYRLAAIGGALRATYAHLFQRVRR